MSKEIVEIRGCDIGERRPGREGEETPHIPGHDAAFVRDDFIFHGGVEIAVGGAIEDKTVVINACQQVFLRPVVRMPDAWGVSGS